MPVKEFLKSVNSWLTCGQKVLLADGVASNTE